MKKRLLTLLAACLALTVSCGDKDNDETGGGSDFSFKEMSSTGETTEISKLEILSSAYSGIFLVESSGFWEIKVADGVDWVTVDPVSGSGTKAVSVSVSFNPTYYPRSSTIEFYLAQEPVGSLPVEQAGKGVVFSVTPESYNPVSSGESFSLTVKTTLPTWKYEISEEAREWLTFESEQVSPTNSSETTLTFKASPNTAIRSARPATISFSSDDVAEFSEAVAITQRQYQAGDFDVIDGMRVAWDYSTIVRPLGGYPRVKLLQDGRLAGVYESGGGAIKYSSDKGATWGGAMLALPNGAFTGTSGAVTCTASNPELIELSDKTLIYGVNYRPRTQDVGVNYSIAVNRSTDGGTTWSAPQVIYEALDNFGDGCWEPAFLELPNGDVQCYFANEGIYTSSGEQNISFMTSTDKGLTWTGPTIASFAAGLRDGMPVPVIIGDQIVMSIEDNRSWFKPYTVRTTIAENWSNGPVPRESAYRDFSLVENLGSSIYQGAPYLIAVPGGTIMSYQTTENQNTTDSNMAVLEVVVGDETARNFTKKTRPFDVPIGTSALWNSLCFIGDNTIMAATSYGGRVIKGYLLNNIYAGSASVTVDGDITPGEWGGELPIFMGHKSNVSLKAAAASDDDNLYLCAELSAAPTGSADGVMFFLDTKYNPTGYSVPHNGVYKIEITSSGALTAYAGFEGKWEATEIAGIQKAVAASGKWEVAIPFSFLGNVEDNIKGALRLGVGFTYTPSGGETYSEYIANMLPDSPYTWMQLSF